MIYKKLNEESELSQEVVTDFKKLYYTKTLESLNHQEINLDNLVDLEHKQNPFELQHEYLKRIIQANLKVFNSAEPEVIDSKVEFIPFMKTCGNDLDKNDIDFFFFITGKKSKLTIDDLYTLSENEIINKFLNYGL